MSVVEVACARQRNHVHHETQRPTHAAHSAYDEVEERAMCTGHRETGID